MTSRNIALDHIKAVACLLIVCHHLAFYGPMADVVQTILPGLIAWLDKYARMAVQVFLVMGGYWAAAAIAPEGHGKPNALWPALSKRYLRLSLPYTAALATAIVVNEVVRSMGFEHASVSATPTWDGVLAHLLLLHSIAGYEALSAGVWYVAIDFQLYALCLLWFWLCRKQLRWPALAQMGVVVATAASLWLWNLNSQLDIWAPYFMGAYGLGMMAWWATHCASPRHTLFWAIVITILTLIALWIGWRDRIALAGFSATFLVTLPYLKTATAGLQIALSPLTWIGLRSYSIFLIHFPISLLVNAAIHRLWPTNMLANALGMLAAVFLSVAAGGVLYRWTEQRSITWPLLWRWQAVALLLGLLAYAWVRAQSCC